MAFTGKFVYIYTHIYRYIEIFDEQTTEICKMLLFGFVANFKFQVYIRLDRNLAGFNLGKSRLF